jgi:small neutral amino acid transporter SnatA (MarC family)
MNLVMVVVAFVAAVNPFRTRLGLPEGPHGRARSQPLLVGLPVGAATLIGLAAASGPLLRWLQVTPETFVIAAGLVVVLGGAWVLGFAEPADEPKAAGWRAGLWPVAYPRVVGPETLVLAVAVGVRDGVAAVAIGLGAGLLLLGALGALPRRPVAARLLVWLGRLTAVLLVLVGVWLMIEGIRDV